MPEKSRYSGIGIRALILFIGGVAGFLLTNLLPLNSGQERGRNESNEFSRVETVSTSGESFVPALKIATEEKPENTGLAESNPKINFIDLFGGLLNADELVERVATRKAYHLSAEDLVTKRWNIPVGTIERIKQDLGPILEKWKQLEKQYSGTPVFIDSLTPHQYSFQIPLFPPPLDDVEEIRIAVLRHLIDDAPKDAWPEDIEKATAFVMTKLGITPLPRVLSGNVRPEGVSAILSVLESPDDFRLESNGGSSTRPVEVTILNERDPRILVGGRYYHLLPASANQQ